MDYVIFDLEWNQCPYGKEKENPKLPFEIIEIGAVKMDSRRNVVGTFHRIVKPVVYQHLHHRTREVIGLTEEELEICFRCFAVFGENMARLTERRSQTKGASE